MTEIRKNVKNIFRIGVDVSKAKHETHNMHFDIVNKRLFYYFRFNVINSRKLGGAHSNIFYHEHEGRKDQEKSFVFVVINNKILFAAVNKFFELAVYMCKSHAKKAQILSPEYI